jgi:hypothetical protein
MLGLLKIREEPLRVLSGLSALQPGLPPRISGERHEHARDDYRQLSKKALPWQ